MKIRNGFVSNSSSSSFMIPLSALSALQRQKVIDHIEEAKALGMEYVHEEDAWSISENEHAIEGWTGMNNFNMEEFLEKIGVDMKYVHIEADG